jgi:hypothetical protein
MLLMNLIEAGPTKKKDRTFRYAVAFLALIVSSLFLASTQSVVDVAVRPLEIEEKEVVISALSRLEKNVPKMVDWVGEFREELLKSSVSIYVSGDQKLTDENLMEVSNIGVAVSPLFFSTDPIAQEVSLMKIVTARNAPLSDSSEIAVVGE